ncbi:hypothetical protein [Aquisphaera insulae]|uniref:hypothetical protein n=1 Tax=Aquisphaera insulae TaxID=2712864 RepID=UPI0013EA7C3B|nr:hypothetical protein [Aquisphaera insulae]
MTPFAKGRSRLHVTSGRGRTPHARRRHCQILPGIERLEGRLLLASSLSAIPLEFVPSTLPPPLLVGTIQPAAGSHVSQSPILTQVRPVVAVASSLNAGRSRASEPSPIPEMILHKEASSDGTYPSDDLVSTPWRPAETEIDGADEGDAVVLPPALTLDTSGLEAIPTVVNLPEVHLTGTVGPDQARVTFKVALNSSTDRLKIRMSRDSSSTEAGIPMIEDILMMGPRGDILSVITGTYESWPDVPMEMTLTLNHVPRGATLVFHVGEAPRSVDPSAGSENGVAGSLNFTLDLSRTNSAGSLPSAPQLVLESPLVIVSQVLAGLYLPTVVPGVSLPRAVGPTSSSLGEESSTNSVEMTSGGIAADLSPVAEGLPGVSVGPLISRGSTAVGPTLATAPGDLTVPLDRNERAFDLASGSAGGETVPVLTSAAEQVAAAGASGTLSPPSRAIGEYSEDLLLVRGPGGLPILATSASRSRHRGESAELIATLPDSRPTAAGVEQPDDGAAGRTGKEAGNHTQPRKLGLFALIFGIVIGITLTSRPFYPELLALVRIRLFGPNRPRTRGGRKSGGSRWSIWAR